MFVAPHNTITQLSIPTITKLKLHQKQSLIETSKDCSKMIANITFTFINCPLINLSIRAENIEKRQFRDSIYVNYELSNKYNSNVRYSIVNVEKEELTYSVCLERIK
ncbi:hypothetical protein ACQ4LE_005824 [Meloidogyne hapla]